MQTHCQLEIDGLIICQFDGERRSCLDTSMKAKLVFLSDARNAEAFGAKWVKVCGDLAALPKLGQEMAD